MTGRGVEGVQSWKGRGRAKGEGEGEGEGEGKYCASKYKKENAEKCRRSKKNAGQRDTVEGILSWFMSPTTHRTN